MQSPSQVFPLDPIYTSEERPETSDQSGTKPGLSVQSIVHFELKEEGNHVLAVNVSYTETSMSSPVPSPGSAEYSAPALALASSRSSTATGGRVRTFRKLYQFLASPCLSVRTKATELIPREVDDKSLGPYGKVKMARFTLESQIENVGESTIVLKVSRVSPVRSI